MRTITIKKSDKITISIESPWLNIEESAQYLNISRSEFLKIVAASCSCKGFGNRRQYNVIDLNAFNPAATQKGESS